MPTRRPIIIAYHLVWTNYGTWLPNDPRGSGSQRVAAGQLAELGPLHFGGRKTQPSPSAVREFYDRADERLYFQVVRFTQPQIDLVASGLADAMLEHTYMCYACAILPDHAHLVVRKHKHRAEAMIDRLQAATRLRLSTADAIPCNRPVWTLGGWKRFLSSPAAVRIAIGYVQNNPLKAGLPQQPWPFVKPHDGWPRRELH